MGCCRPALSKGTGRLFFEGMTDVLFVVIIPPRLHHHDKEIAPTHRREQGHVRDIHVGVLVPGISTAPGLAVFT